MAILFLANASMVYLAGIIIATVAAVIDQALISGSFTLISEAMRLNLWQIEN
jgi:K+ transporter